MSMENHNFLIGDTRDTSSNPTGSMYGIFIYICLIFMVNVNMPYMDPMGMVVLC